MKKIGVIGCGLMGAGIAEVCARHGLSVTIIERDAASLAGGEERIKKSLDRALGSNKIEQTDYDSALGNLTFSLDYGSLAQADLVIEAVAEIDELKFEVFRTLFFLPASSQLGSSSFGFIVIDPGTSSISSKP